MIKGRVPQLFFSHDREINGPHLDYDLSRVKAKEQNIWTRFDILLLIFINLKLATRFFFMLLFIFFFIFLPQFPKFWLIGRDHHSNPYSSVYHIVLKWPFSLTLWWHICSGLDIVSFTTLDAVVRGCKIFQKWGPARGRELVGNTAWGLDSALNQAQTLSVSWSTNIWTNKISRFLCRRQNPSHHACHCHDELHSLNHESM